jgi:hypothetical protein
MNEHQVRPGEEWGGHKSTKFWPTKKHVQQEITIDPNYKQIFDSNGRKHYEPGQGKQPDWKPSVRQVEFDQIHEVKRDSCKGFVNKSNH